MKNTMDDHDNQMMTDDWITVGLGFPDKVSYTRRCQYVNRQLRRRGWLSEQHLSDSIDFSENFCPSS